MNISMFNRNGKLYIQYFLDGKIKQKSTRLPDTPKNRKLVQTEVIPQLLLKLKSGELGAKAPKEFDYYASIYLRQKESLKTYQETYNIVVNQLYPVFGKNTRVDKISRAKIREWVDKKLQEISPKRMRRLLQILVAIFDIAIEYEHIEKNPAKNITLPSHKPIREMKPFTQKEVLKLLSNADGILKYYLAIAFFTGMRPGEIIALTISDINLEKRLINVNKRIKKGEINTPKTKSSIRKVPISNDLIPYFKELIQFAINKKTLLLFTTKNNKPFYSSDKLHNTWYKLLEKCNIPKRPIYNTRHTFATLAIKNNMPIYQVSRILGHKNMQETLTTYAKFVDDEYLKINNDFSIFTDNLSDSQSKITM